MYLELVLSQVFKAGLNVYWFSPCGYIDDLFDAKTFVPVIFVQ